MKANNFLHAAMLATGLLGAVAAQAANNPLKPDYLWGKTNVAAVTSANVAIAAPSNPLQPAYYASKAGAENFVATSTADQTNVNAGNPLHPSFNRI